MVMIPLLLTPLSISFQVYDSDTRVDSTQKQLDNVLAGNSYNGSHDLLAEATAPTCEEFILECK